MTECLLSTHCGHGHFGDVQSMKQKSEAEAMAEAAGHSTGSRQEIEASTYCGCLSCSARFDANEVVDWRHEWAAPEKQNRVKRWAAKPSWAGAVREVNQCRQSLGKTLVSGRPVATLDPSSGVGTPYYLASRRQKPTTIAN